MYYIMAIKRLFFARTNNSDFLIAESKSCDTGLNIIKYLNQDKYSPQLNLDMSEKKEISKHRLIRMSFKDSFLLFLQNYCPRVIMYCCPCWKHNKQIIKLYQDGKMRIEKDLNIIKLVRNLKRLKIIMKSSLMDKDVKF